MSLEKEVEIKCPKCGELQKTMLWKSLNADVDPQAREALLKGQINIFTCQKCNFRSPFPISLMYHDMTRQFCIQYFPVHYVEKDDFLKEFTKEGCLNLTRTPQMPDYMTQPHIVFDMDDLRYYVMFRERLFEHFKNNSNKKKEAGIKSENSGKTKKDGDEAGIEEWENFTSYCIKCGKLKTIHNNKCDIDVYHMRNKKFIPICHDCFAQLPEIPDGYLDDAATEPDNKDGLVQEVITYIFKCRQNKTLGLDKNFASVNDQHAG